MFLSGFLELFELRQVGFPEEILVFIYARRHEMRTIVRIELRINKEKKRRRVWKERNRPFIDRKLTYRIRK